jgi:hypothetical protein
MMILLLRRLPYRIGKLKTRKVGLEPKLLLYQSIPKNPSRKILQ